ncbi:MAG: two-component regulator propeller domain-containing protein [Bacteroidota bacterium]
MNESTGQFKKIPRDTSLGPAVKNDYVFDLCPASDGNIWVGTNGGVYTIDPSTLRIHSFTDHPLLKQLSGLRVNAIYEDRQGKMWISTISNGVYCYDPEGKPAGCVYR